MAALTTGVRADVFYKTKVIGKISHVSLISNSQKIGQFKINVAFSAFKCRATLEGEPLPCSITTMPVKEKYGLITYSFFKVSLNLPIIIKKSCNRDNRCEQLLNIIRNCHSNYFEVSFRKVRVLHLNDRSAENVLQIDTPSKEEAFHIVSRVHWPREK